MKKLILLTVFTLFTLTAFAQGDIRFGASLGLNISGISGDDTEGTESRTGFRGGAVVDIPVSEKFAIQPVAAISIQGWRDSGFDIKANYVVIEAKADYEVVENLSLQAGPLLGINIHASVDGDDITNFESTNIGVLVGAQYEFPMGLFINLQYDKGFSDLINGFDAKNYNFSASLGWFFN
ncbi:porin family protein [Constantimarinum furrinae]|uniref:Outer membrane protein beta-barrel domain-containing protein n=1 Tax=Constantimarinum furrinae TaxID=2562285 RepID=A0A7G8PX23_9FLAO|nr:porin family protein [Constantimarinum furrinae]QNJ98889.1 hypothetical protein ALE3EI_2350 [Constantimarinum furrinae]